MPRPEKVQAVAEIKERLEGASAVFVAEYAGLSVREQQELRRSLRASDSEFKVVKMTLARLAADELGLEGLSELLVGPTGLAFADADAAATAKVLSDFAKAHGQLVVKGAVLAGEMLPPERVSQLADLEPREVLLAKIAGAFQAPMTQMAQLMAALPRGLATAMQQLIEKSPEPVADEPEAEAAAPADEPVAEEITETDEPAAAPEGEDDSPEPEAAAETDEPAAAPEGEDDSPEPEAAAETDEPAAVSEGEDDSPEPEAAAETDEPAAVSAGEDDSPEPEAAAETDEADEADTTDEAEEN